MCSNYWLKSMLTAAVLLCSTAVSSPAQWVNYRDPLTPRTEDGKPNLSAPAPKTPDGKPDLSGIWQADDLTHFFDLNADHQQAEVPFQPWTKALSGQRQESQHKDDPLSRCMPAGVPRINTIAPLRSSKLHALLSFFTRRPGIPPSGKYSLTGGRFRWIHSPAGW